LESLLTVSYYAVGESLLTKPYSAIGMSTDYAILC
jgi:hypothetical protein